MDSPARPAIARKPQRIRDPARCGRLLKLFVQA